MGDIELADMGAAGHLGQRLEVLGQDPVVEVSAQGVAPGRVLSERALHEQGVGVEGVGDLVPVGQSQPFKSGLGGQRPGAVPRVVECVRGALRALALPVGQDAKSVLEHGDGGPLPGRLPVQGLPHPELLIAAHLGASAFVVAPGLLRYAGPLSDLLHGQIELDPPVAHGLGDIRIRGLVPRTVCTPVVRTAHSHSSDGAGRYRADDGRAPRPTHPP